VNQSTAVDYLTAPGNPGHLSFAHSLFSRSHVKCHTNLSLLLSLSERGIRAV